MSVCACVYLQTDRKTDRQTDKQRKWNKERPENAQVNACVIKKAKGAGTEGDEH